MYYDIEPIYELAVQDMRRHDLILHIKQYCKFLNIPLPSVIGYSTDNIRSYVLSQNTLFKILLLAEEQRLSLFEIQQYLTTLEKQEQIEKIKLRLKLIRLKQLLSDGDRNKLQQDVNLDYTQIINQLLQFVS